MIVSAKGRYALRIMIALAARGKEACPSLPVPLKELAKEEEIPYKYLESIMCELAKAGLVESARGKRGGYLLALPPERCTAADILKVTETSFTAAACAGGGSADCPRAEMCPTLPMWRALDLAVDELLSQYCLADFI